LQKPSWLVFNASHTGRRRCLMRIMHLINHYGRPNCHVNVSVDMACTQVTVGHSVAYGCSVGDYIGLLERHGVKVFYIAEPDRGVRQFFFAGKSLWKAVSEFRPKLFTSTWRRKSFSRHHSGYPATKLSRRFTMSLIFRCSSWVSPHVS
jgi:hypothetical protein